MSTDRHLQAPVRAWTGLVLGAVGAVLLWLGWYEVAGETLVAKQLPFVASASIPGAALVIAGAVLIAGDISRRGSDQAEAMVGALYELLTEPLAGGAATPNQEEDPTVVAVPGGTRYHRRDCPLVQGKADVQVVTRAEAAPREMQPCPVCGAVLPD